MTNAYRDIIDHLKKAAQDLIKENDRLSAQLQRITAERDALRKLVDDGFADQTINALRQRLNVEEDLVNDFAAKLAGCQQELEQYKAAVLLADPAVAAELKAHGVDVVEGVPV